jgi:hypothetical protein
MAANTKLSRTRYRELQAEVKRRINELMGSEAPSPERLNAIEQVFTELGDQSDIESLIRRLLICNTYIFHFSYWGKLNLSRLKQVEDIGLRLLPLIESKVSSQTWALIRTEHTTMLSQIRRRQGLHLESSWYQCIASYYADVSDETSALSAFATANRFMRLGDLDLADAYYGRLLEADRDSPYRVDAQLRRLKIARLRGDDEWFERRLQEILSIPELSPSLRLEADWEVAVRQMQPAGNLAPILKMVGKRGTHYLAGYIVEATLIGLAHPDRAWLKLLPSMEQLRKKTELQAFRLEHQFEVTRLIQSAYDPDLSIARRLDRLTEIVQQIGCMIQIDHEVLAWLALQRVCERTEVRAAHSTAELAQAQYRALSLRLTAGQKPNLFLPAAA